MWRNRLEILRQHDPMKLYWMSYQNDQDMQNEETDVTEIKHIEIKSNTCFLGARSFRGFNKQRDPIRKTYIY